MQVLRNGSVHSLDSAESDRRWREHLRSQRFGNPNGGRGERSCWAFLVACFAALAVLPFVFLLVVSLSPNYIKALPTYRVRGDVVVNYATNTTTPIMITVGPAGGCIWVDDITGSPAKCTAALPFIPDPTVLHLPSNQTLTNAFPVALGRALAVNHLATALSGLALILVALDFMVWKRGYAKYAVQFTALIVWLAFALQIAYVVTLNKRLGADYDQLYTTIGNGFWFVMVSGIVISFFICGCGDTSVANTANMGYVV